MSGTTGTNLYEAHKQWRDRPADERFSSLAELHAVVKARRDTSVASRLTLRDIRFDVSPESNQLVVSGKQSAAVPSHWAFSQLCEMLDAPAGYMRRLPDDLAAENLNWATRNAPRDTMMMLWANGSTPGIVRAFTSTMYQRLWDEQVVAWLRRMTNDESNGWHRPAAKTDNEYPSGLYAGDRNVFAFLVNDEHRIDDGSDGGLGRGFFCWNSEVKQMSFGFSAFLYRYVCGNHIVWGAQELFSVRMAHIGAGMTSAAEREFGRMIGAYVNSNAQGEQKTIDAARVYQIAPTKAETVGWLIQKGRGFVKAEAQDMVDYAEKQGQDPTNLWNIVNAGTFLSQRKAHADERTRLDRAAGKLLEVVF